MKRSTTSIALRALVPVVLAIVLAMLPPPPGLAPHAWLYFAIFVAVVAGLVLEPVPGPAVGLIAVALVAALARWVLFSPVELGRTDIDATAVAIRWALAGFVNTTV